MRPDQIRLVHMYLFKLSEQLLQAEVQANHIEACAQAPPSPFRCLRVLYCQTGGRSPMSPPAVETGAFEAEAWINTEAEVRTN